jgi:hypothetical protein
MSLIANLIQLGEVQMAVAVCDFNSSGRLGVAVATESNVMVLIQQP